MTVAAQLDKMGLPYKHLELGEVTLIQPMTENQRQELKDVLHEYGLELMEDKKAITVEKIITIIINMIHETKEFPAMSFSKYLETQLNQDYHYLSALFSKTKGITIEHFVILHKIERVKELIMYDELNLTEISYQLQYSSVAHLSNQFKKITGLTPSFFKSLKNKKRLSLASI
jgi:AraC-like DNA-binding protein